MAQTREMKRLLLDGKPIGFQLTTALINDRCQTYYSPKLKPHATIEDILNSWHPESFSYLFDYNSFELGIKVGDEWWFEGDRGQHDICGRDLGFTLMYNPTELMWEIIFDDKTCEIRQCTLQFLSDSKCTSNIHEEKV